MSSVFDMPKMMAKGKKKDKSGPEITAGKKPAKATAIGAPFPNINSMFTGRKLDVKLLKETARSAPVSRNLWQLQLIAFPWFDFKIVPDGAEEDLEEDENKKLITKLERLDRTLQTNILCAQAMYDIVTFGSALFEITWTEDEDGYYVPDVLQRLPAESFRQAPPGVSGNKENYIVGNILKGIVYDKKAQSYQYWQLQDSYGSTGIPIQIPTEQIIHIKDARSSYIDGEPYLAGIVSTISQLEYVRKKLMQTVTRVGTPKQTATVGIPPSYIKMIEANQVPVGITSAVPGASTTPYDSMMTDLWDLARTVVENQNSDLAIAVPEGIKIDYERPSIPFNPTEVDQYLIKEAIYHIFPRDILEVAAQAISTTSSPLLELLKMMVQGWQSLCSLQFENQVWNKFLELNGYEGYRIELDWASLIPPDQQKIESLAIQKFNLHITTLNECRSEIGLPILDPAPWMENLSEREVLERELSIWRTGGQQPPGQQGGGMDFASMFGGGEGEEAPPEESYEEETSPEEDYSQEEPEQSFMESGKQNASYQEFSTPSKLDSEVEDILNSIKNDVMTSIKKTKYFTKNSNETSD